MKVTQRKSRGNLNPKKLENHVFISYSRDDQQYVDRLAEWLKAVGIPVWLDHDIDYGTTWTQTIEKNLDAAGAIVVVMSNSSRESAWVSREISRAERKGKRIFPLLLSGEPLLQFETTQYENVSDGSLPSPKFADTVAKALGLMLRGLASDLLDVVARYRESGVLILGRFTPRRKSVLDALRDSLRQRGLIPIIFDFAPPANLALVETVLLLALTSRFIIADLTDALSVQNELAAIVPHVLVPVVPIIQKGHKTYAMFDILRRRPWVLPLLIYANQKELIANIDPQIVQAAENAYQELHSAS